MPLNTAETAVMLSVPRSTVYSMMRRGIIAPDDIVEGPGYGGINYLFYAPTVKKCLDQIRANEVLSSPKSRQYRRKSPKKYFQVSLFDIDEPTSPVPRDAEIEPSEAILKNHVDYYAAKDVAAITFLSERLIKNYIRKEALYPDTYIPGRRGKAKPVFTGETIVKFAECIGLDAGLIADRVLCY